MSEIFDQSSSDLETQFSLIEQAKANESSAWEMVFAIYTPLIQRWARKCGVTCPYEIENICQEVFTKLIKNLYSFKRRESGGSFRGWLHVITRNYIYTHHLGTTKNSFQVVGGSHWHEMLNQIPFVPHSTNSLFDSSAEQNTDETTLIFRRIMEWIETKYSATQRTVFKRLVIDERSAREVADELNLTVNVVYQYKSRILARIREVFKDLV